MERRSAGFTLSELLIAVVIVGVLLAAGLVLWKQQINRAYDARRKDDLQKFKRAFEEYYNDHGCYPPVDMLNNCGGAQLQPYIAKITCDPVTKLPYQYVAVNDANGQPCNGYRILATLYDTSDTDITRLRCSATQGCGFGVLYNYGVSSGVPVSIITPGVTPTPTSGPGATSTPTPTNIIVTISPTPVPGGIWACVTLNNCNNVGESAQCSPKYLTAAECNANCTQPSQVITCN